MKAIVFTEYGDPKNLEFLDVPDPSPQEDEVLVRVHASSINSWDWEYLTGTPFANRLMFGLFKPRRSKQRLGADIAAVVEAECTKATRFRPGDAVFGDLWEAWGGFAELACIPETSLEPIPANLSFAQAAAVPQAGVLALSGYRKHPGLGPGNKVLINGAGGGVGMFAIQLAKLDGIEVTGVDAGHKLDAMRSFGADHVIDFAQEDFTGTGVTYDLIIDCQYSRPWSRCRRALTPTGRYAVIGGQVPRIMRAMLGGQVGKLFGRTSALQVVMDGPNKDLDHLCELLEAGKLVSHLDSSFMLEQVPQALQYFGEGHHKGKIAITVV